MTQQPQLITLTDPRSPAADAYRSLRTNLQFTRLDNPLKTVGITSPAEDNHKGRAAANLAVTLAQSGKKVILVDADLRRPSQHTLWGKENKRGLTTLLLENLDAKSILQATNVENLQLLTSGDLPPNPVDVLASNRMDSLLEQLKTQADILLFEMPPVLVAADASVLGQKLDGVVLVLQANKSRRDHTARAKEQLERVKVNLLGGVLLDAPLDRASTQYR
jgi:capsular exopolysaccharide synthesis family protein